MVCSQLLDPELVEQDLRVGLGPQADAPGRRGVERLLEHLLAVELDREFLAAQRGDQRVPGLRGSRRVADGVEDRTLAAHDVEEQDVVLERVRPHAQPDGSYWGVRANAMPAP